MDFFQNITAEGQNWLILGALALIFVTLILSLLAIRNTSPEKAFSGFDKLNELVQRLTAQLIDTQARSDREHTELLSRLNKVTADLHHLQAEVAELAQVVLAGATETPTEKKNELIQRFVEAVEAPRDEAAFIRPEPVAISPELVEIQAALAELKPQEALSTGLEKTRRQFFSKFRALFRGETLPAESIEELEELLISSDLGVRTTSELIRRIKGLPEATEGSVRHELKELITSILKSDVAPEIVPVKREGQPLVIVVVGVNGVGKTTTIGKLAAQFKKQGARVLVGACDTFRAAASEQLGVWAERIGVEVVSGPDGTKPTTVAFQAVHRAKDEGFDVLIVDTAGRLHTRVNLMNELVSVLQLIEREQPGAPHESLLVVDATTGQNALQQAREFHQKAKLTGLVVTKLDGTPKGGIVVAIKDELGIPIRYVGVGESVESLRLFSPVDFVEALFQDEVSSSDELSFRGQTRRRRRSESVELGDAKSGVLQ